MIGVKVNAIRVVDFEVICRPGNVVSMLSASKPNGSGWYVAAYNHDTRKLQFDDNALRIIFGRHRLTWLILLALLVLPLLVLLMPGFRTGRWQGFDWIMLFVLGALLGGFLGKAIGFVFSAIAASSFKTGPAMAAAREALKAFDVARFAGPSGMIRSA